MSKILDIKSNYFKSSIKLISQAADSYLESGSLTARFILFSNDNWLTNGQYLVNFLIRILLFLKFELFSIFYSDFWLNYLRLFLTFFHPKKLLRHLSHKISKIYLVLAMLLLGID